MAQVMVTNDRVVGTGPGAWDVVRAIPPDSRPVVKDADDLGLLRLGDTKAFERLYDRYWAPVAAVALRVIGDPDQARDIAQEAFVQLHRRPPADEVPVVAWLFRVATNRAWNELRRNGRRQSREVRDFQGRTVENSASEIAQANLDAERLLVRETLLELPERMRELLILHSENIRYADIAAVVGVAPSSVGTLLARAERAFRTSYEARRGGR